MSDNPHANGGLLLRDLKMPDFRDYAVKVPSPATTTAEAAREMGKFLRDVMKQNLAANFRLFSPDENNSNRWQDVLEVTTACYMAENPRRTTSSPRRPRDGGAQRAPVPGLAGGLPADRPARLLLVLRGVHPHHRLDVQPARQVAEDRATTSRGGGRSPRSTTSSARTSGGRTTTASATRTRASSTTSSTRRPRSSASTCRRTPTACCRSPTTACAAATTSTSWSPASSRPRSG